MKARVFLLICMLSVSPFASAREQERQGEASSQITIPAVAPTIPSEAMFALGQQSGQLMGINNRLDRIDNKLDGFQSDLTRINTIGGLALLLTSGVILPIVVYRVQQRLGKSQGEPNSAL